MKPTPTTASTASPPPGARSGTVLAKDGIHAQHVDLYRKLSLRKRLCSSAGPGAVYVPFCGDGDIAVELYNDRRIYAADLDPERVVLARGRLRDADVRVADCDVWPFAGVQEPFAIADFDAYGNPYKSLAAFWAAANKADPIVLVGTDGMRLQHQLVKCKLELPSGHRAPAEQNVSREQNSFWWPRYVLPWLTDLVKPGRIVARQFYARRHMLYWGVVVNMTEDGMQDGEERVEGEGGSPAAEQVEQALFDAAVAGNIKAIATWLQRHRPAAGVPDAAGTPEERRTSKKTVRAKDFWFPVRRS